MLIRFNEQLLLSGEFTKDFVRAVHYVIKSGATLEDVQVDGVADFGVVLMAYGESHKVLDSLNRVAHVGDRNVWALLPLDPVSFFFNLEYLTAREYEIVDIV